MTSTTKTVKNPYDAAYWDARRAERLAQERADADVHRDIALDYERQAILAEAVERLARRVEAADAQVAQYAAERGVNHAYYRGKGEGLEVALAVLRGVITDRSAR